MIKKNSLKLLKTKEKKDIMNFLNNIDRVQLKEYLENRKKVDLYKPLNYCTKEEFTQLKLTDSHYMTEDKTWKTK